MDDKHLRETLLERLHVEIQLFKDSMLCRDKEDIYAECYKIELYINIYEILVEETDRMPELLLRKLLYQNFGILDAFYQEWLGRDDSSYAELREYVEDELEVRLADNGNYDGKENGNGKGYNKAA